MVLFSGRKATAPRVRARSSSHHRRCNGVVRRRACRRFAEHCGIAHGAVFQVSQDRPAKASMGRQRPFYFIQGARRRRIHTGACKTRLYTRGRAEDL